MVHVKEEEGFLEIKLPCWNTLGTDDIHHHHHRRCNTARTKFPHLTLSSRFWNWHLPWELCTKIL